MKLEIRSKNKFETNTLFQKFYNVFCALNSSELNETLPQKRDEEQINHASEEAKHSVLGN